MGNGTSVAFNAELTSDALATAVSARLPRRLVRAAENAASDRGRGDPRANFEDLLGPLDRMAAALGPLRDVARVADPALAAQVDATEQMVRGLYGKGVGAALAIVAERSTAYHGAELDAYSRFPRWVLRRPRRGEDAIVRFFNLNYDSPARQSPARIRRSARVLAGGPGGRSAVATTSATSPSHGERHSDRIEAAGPR